MPKDVNVILADEHEIASRGRKIYHQLPDELEINHRGEFIAIDPDSGDYFIGKTMFEAVESGRKKYPGKIFYVAKIGYPAVYTHRGL